MNTLLKSDSRSEAKRALLAERLRMVADADDAVPLSFAQQRLWFLDQLEPGSAVYNVPTVVQMTGSLDVAALQRALDALVARHEILRTRFVGTEGNPVQIADDTARVKLAQVDLSGQPESERLKAARARMQAEVNLPFDFSSTPPVRATLLRLSPTEHWFILTLHHIISDEWSLKICFRELTEFYEAARQGRTPVLPDLPIQYADYAVWQREWLRGEILEDQLGYWQWQLRGNPPVLELPADHPRPPVASFSGSNCSRPLPETLTRSLKELGARHDATLFMVLLAAFKTLLHRYTQQEDLVIGSPIAGRTRLETEPLIGFFVNTVILRTDASGDPTFEEFLARVREVTLGAYAHQDLPFEKVVEELHPERTLSHMPFTRVMFSTQGTLLEEWNWPNLTLRLIEVESETSKFDLTFVVQETARGLVAQAEYNRELFEADSIERLLQHFELLLNGIAAHPEQRLSELPLLAESEQRQLLVEWNNTRTAYPREQCVHELFEAQAARTPDAVAVAFGNNALTYRELNSRANQLAWRLRKLSVGPEVLVGVCLERSVDLVVSMLGILKAGGAYVPLDPAYPKERLAFMLTDARAPVLLTKQRLLSCLPRGVTPVICLDSDWELTAGESGKNPSNQCTPENLAYVIYTSGSTGRPKGVAVPHRAVVRLVLDTNYIQLGRHDRVAQVSNASFDAVTFEIWGALLNGARLVGINKDVALSPRDFARELRDREISALFVTTALFNQLAGDAPGALATVRTVLFGGEAVDPKWVGEALAHQPPQRLLHVYGPTENTTFSTWHPVEQVASDATTIPIGRPVSNTQCYVLDARLNLVPIGIPGELYVGGDGLARGYLNHPDLTAERFVRHPFPRGAAPELLYRTGDLVRWLPNGTLEFLGRLDHQVKIRGFRVELDEVQSVLSRHPDVRECVVTMHQDGAEQKQLVAHFVAGRRAPTASDLRRFLNDQLPDYMVPSAFVQLDALPLTPNGKINRHALPEPGRARPKLEKNYATPRDEVELKLTEIWENVLGIHPIGIEDKFFDLGGHSLLAVRLIAQIEKAFQRKLRLATIFQAQTIEQLAAILREEIQEGQGTSGMSLVEIHSEGSRPPIFFVHGAGGGMFWGYVNLSRHLGPDQPVYGLKSRGLDEHEEFDSIEEMAAQYVADLRSACPQGPYYLGGYCFGGNVAFEMARQLEEAGERIALLALLNCAPPNSSYTRIPWSPLWTLRFGRNVFYWMNYFRNWSPSQRREFFRWKREMLRRRLARWFGKPADQPSGVDAGNLVDLSSYSPEQRRLWEAHIRALTRYHPKSYSGRVHLFRSPGHPLVCSFDPDYGWNDLTKGGVQTSIIPGVHEKILEEPCVQKLAEDLRHYLNEASQNEVHRVQLESRPHRTARPAPREDAGEPARRPESNPIPTNAQRAEPDRTWMFHFQAQVRRTPNALALRFRGEELTYSELDERSSRLAQRLQELGVGPETLVAVRLDRSLNWPVSLLAILKAGGAYLPLDPSYPDERLAYLLTDSKARVLITETKYRSDTTADSLATICLDAPDEIERLSRYPARDLVSAATPDQLAYVIYTSGSTGLPKGVEITQRSLLNHNQAIARAFHLQPEDRVLQFSPFSFDISVEELFPTWMCGCTVVMRTDEAISTPARFFEFIRKEALTVLNLPTAYWHELVEFLQTEPLPPSVRLVIIGGEKASDEAWQHWKQRVPETVTLINAYGPTETTVTATLHVARPDDVTLPIGRPLANVHALILDADLRPTAPGEAGELYLGGTGLARGYRHRPELTAERFVANPFKEISSPRLYRTGDRARCRADGCIEYLGRVDDQVKIRGYRIEPGEIEAALRAHPALKEAVVVVREDAAGKKKLIAYVVARDPAAGTGELRNFLKAKLPPWMVPSAFVRLESMPSTPSGKIDRHALPAPGDTRPELNQQFVAPRTPIEEVLAGIWCEVLELNRVGVHDNFFDLGGHSLLATQVISRMRDSLQVEIPLGTLFAFPTVAGLSEVAKASLQREPILPQSAVKGKRTPLTPAQHRIWFLDQFEPQQSPYNNATGLRLKGALNLRALEQSLSELARRHEILRAIYPAEDGLPVQIVREANEVQLPVLDLTDLPENERQARALQIMAQEGRKPHVMFSPVLRPILLRLADTEHALLFVTHQIACDARSVRLLLDELIGLYEAFATGTTLTPGPGPLDTAAEVRTEPDAEREQINYWKHQLAGAPALLDLPADRSRPAHQSDAGARQPVLMSREITVALENLARDENCTVFATLLAVFQTLLSRYTGSTDLVVGSTIASPGSNERIGKFDNLVALRSDLSGDPAFSEFLGRVRTVVDSALANGSVPFAAVLEELQPARNASYSPVFQVMFDFESDPLPKRAAAGIQFRPIEIDNQTAKLDLKLYLANAPEGLTGWVEYSTALFDADRISRLIEHFGTMLVAVVENRGQQLSLLPLMPESESNLVVKEWNATRQDVPAAATLAQLFEAQVLRSPDALALAVGSERLTYRELNARANQLAHFLRSAGVGPESLVGICMERSWRMIVGILGVLKAGGAYVPMDPAYPKDRLEFILEDTQAPVLLTQASLNVVGPRTGTRVIRLDSDWAQVASQCSENPFSGAERANLAYVIYTSGSTGKPKGVAIEHHSAVALVAWAKNVFTKDEIAGVLASTSICFDLSVFEMFVPLSWGGAVILADNALALPALPARDEVTLINSVPSAMRELLRVRAVPASVQVVNLAGEPLTSTLVDQIYGQTAVQKVYDLYGPSETTTYSTFKLRQPGQRATIGRPLANEQVYLLDAHQQPVPIGVPGELYIGGVGVARGYLNRPELTQEKFVSNPFELGTRLYRTGDLARWWSDGDLEFLGRMDHQVKIRGFRIELGEIESALRKHPDLRDAVVLAREDQPGDKRLAAYVVAKPTREVSADALRNFLKQQLPEYMVPPAMLVLDALPLTPNGKVDRKALPAPETDRRQSPKEFVSPSSAIEEQLAQIWRDVLHLKEVGIQDNFFELGGHSLLAIQVIARMREVFKVELPLFGLFAAPTIAKLAEGLASGQWTQNVQAVPPLQHVPRDQDLPVSFVQERLWFLDQLEPGGHAYNVPLALRLKGEIDAIAFQRALDEIIRRHEALRTSFAADDGNLKAVIAPFALLKIEPTDLTDVPASEREARMQMVLDAEAQRPFDLANGPLIRVSLVRLGEEDHALLVVMHHTVSDGWSLTLFFRELEVLYHAFSGERTGSPLPELPIQYADFAHWKRHWMQGAVLEQELAWWREKLANAPASVDLPTDRGEPAQPSRRGERTFTVLSKERTEALAALTRRESATPFMVLMTGLAVTLWKWTRQRDLVVGTVVAGRSRRETENVIGCFMNFLPIRMAITGDETGLQLLESVKTAVLDAQGHQDCPFEKIVEAINPERKLNRNPLYNVALLLQNFPTEFFKSDAVQVSPMAIAMESALLDLRWEAEHTNQGLSLMCEYRSDLFDSQTIEQLQTSYREVLETLVRDPSMRVSEIGIAPALQEQAESARGRQEEQTIAISATFTAEPVEESLRYWMEQLAIPVRIEFAPYHQVFQQLLDPRSALGANPGGLNVLLVRPEDWMASTATVAEPGASSGEKAELERTANEFVSALRSAANRSATPHLVLLCPPSTSAAADPQRLAALDRLEQSLAAELEKVSGVYVVTSREFLDLYPMTDYYDASGDELGRVPYTPVGFTALGTMIARKFRALLQPAPKVIVLDCDQTLWAGVCGEDGVNGICLDAPRRALQEFMRAQHESGKLLALCSKNNEEDVAEVFARRLDLPLRPEHFAAARLNWLSKSENLKSIAKELDLGLESFAFLDDNPVECAEVEAHCPDVLALQLPEDPEQIPQFLKHCWAFDTLKVTVEDRRRGEMYRQNRERRELQTQSLSLADFLAGLELSIDIARMTPAQLSRVAQLTQRTNQFNLTTLRRTEAEIQKLTDDARILAVSVHDRFGDYGLVGVLIYEPGADSLTVDTFLLSCRVLGRGVEHRMLAELGKLAVAQKVRWLDVHFHPSVKNQPAADFLERTGAAFRQPLNGGFLYRFPAEIAAQTTFQPQSDERIGGDKVATEPRSVSGPKNTGKFTQCRAIALEANDAARIHQAIEAKIVSRLGRQSAAMAEPRTEMERRLCGIWEKLLRIERVGRRDNFFELGGHSLLAVRLFVEIEKITGHKFPLVTLFQAPTIEQLARALDPAETVSRSPIFPIQSNGTRPPLFLVHGAGGDVLWGYANLVKHLHPDQPVYGIKSRGQIGLEEYEHIEEMARYYLDEVKRLQPEGPYYLGGYCFGGNVAYEMARQLQAQGERAALIALLDTAPANAGYERITWWRPTFVIRFVRNLGHWLDDFGQQPAAERRRFILRKLRVLRRRLARKLHGRNGAAVVDVEEVIDPVHFPKHELKLWEVHIRAIVEHVERPYNGGVTLFRTRGQPLLCSFEEDFCWSKLAKGQVTIKHIPGSHENVFMEPNVKFLAEALETSLAEARAKTPTVREAARS